MRDVITNLVPGLLSGNTMPGSMFYRHPEYDRRWWWREFGRLSYLGGREYHRPSRLSVEFQYPIADSRNQLGQYAAGGNARTQPDSLSVQYRSLLFRHDREKEWEFFNRQKRAYYPNFVRTVVNMLVSHATKLSPFRKGDDLTQEFWHGVDQERQTTIDQFVRDGLRWAQVMGIMWACVDVLSEKDGGDGKPYVYWVSPLDILDWAVDEDGEIVWIKQFVYLEKQREWNEAVTPQYQFRIWYQDRVETYNTNEAGQINGDKIVRPYDIGIVPFVPLYSLRDETYPFPDGTALAADLCKSANHVYNVTSLLSEILYKQTFSWLAVPDKNVDVLQMGVNTAFGYDPQGTSAKPEYISPDAEQAKVLLEAINDAMSQARQSVGTGRGRQEGSMQKQSADALELEAEDKRTILSDIAFEAEDFERRLIDVVQKYRNVAPTDETFIQYAREFDVRTMQSEIDEVLSFRQLGTSPEIDLEMVEALLRRKFSGMPPDRVTELMDSLEQAKTGGDPRLREIAMRVLGGKAAPPAAKQKTEKDDIVDAVDAGTDQAA